MLKRSQSRMRPRHFRSSSTSPRVHQQNARMLGFVGVILLLFAVAFLYAKLGSPSSASGHGSSHEFSLGRRLITELPTDAYIGHQKPVERASHANDISNFFKKEGDSFFEDIPKQFEEVKRRNGSIDLGDQDYVHEDEEDTLDDDAETDAELQVNGVDEFENAGNNAADGLDDMDDDDDVDDQDDVDEQQEDLDKRVIDSDEDTFKQIEKEVNVKAKMAGASLVGDGKLQAFEDKHDPEKQVQKVVLNSIGDFPNRKLGNEKSVDNGLEAEESHLEKSQTEQKAVKSLSRSGGIRTIPRWDPLEGLGSELKTDNLSSNGLDRIASIKKDGIVWDHLLSVARKAGNPKKHQYSYIDENSSSEMTNASEAFINQREMRSSMDSPTVMTEIYSSDDEPLDQKVNNKLEEVKAIEDALLLPNEKGRIGLLPSWTDTPAKKSNKGDTSRRERSSKFPLDLLNPANNPLLQDPDTAGPSSLSATDKALLKALRKTANNVGVVEPGKGFAKDSINENSSLRHKVEVGIVKTSNAEANEGISNLVTGGNAAERSILEIESTYSDSTNDRTKTSTAVESGSLATTESKASGSIAEYEVPISKEPKTSLTTNLSLDARRWGFFPGYNPLFTFSQFLQHFLTNNNCSLRIFMAWTSPPWAYSVRYQRGLESLLHFHPQACVVVFSESIELNFFSSFVEEGFKVAVVAPNLEELLEDTPTDIFASVWLAWRKIPLFHIHYTELLRLAALYKYGGIYLDTDVIVVKPLDSLQNVVGAEDSESHVQKLNGAVMAFEKNSSFLWECLREFTATYDDQLLEFNGAELLMRVVDTSTAKQSRNQNHQTDVSIMPPHIFFPLSRQNITRYFQAPSNEQQQREDDQLLQLIYNQSLTLHFWNQKTGRLVPEIGSVVERVINNHCIRCLDYL